MITERLDSVFPAIELRRQGIGVEDYRNRLSRFIARKLAVTILYGEQRSAPSGLRHACLVFLFLFEHIKELLGCHNARSWLAGFFRQFV